MKVKEILTLSTYGHGKHCTDGEITDLDVDMLRVSFDESLTPILEMLTKFKGYKLGSKVEVTIEIEDKYKTKI
jgi:hypothetical protein